MNTMLDELRTLTQKLGRPLRLMEVCGTHTVEIFRHGIRSVLPPSISLLSGPGCPVCVTPIRDIDAAIEIAKQNGVVLATFGDMMRVPGGRQALNEARSDGADVRVVYSPLDALQLAVEHPSREIVFFATGFETTSPLIAASLVQAEQKGIRNFSVYAAHKLVPPALRALLDSPDVQVDGFILPGHVSAVIGTLPYAFLAEEYRKPGVVTGFEARDIIEAIVMICRRLTAALPGIDIQYRSVVKPEGNPTARKLLYEVFEPADATWRGIGTIPLSGLQVRERYRAFDAQKRYPIVVPYHPEPELCSCGEILRGVKVPTDCAVFGTACTPERPIGACMVSTEGSCAAYYKYGQR